MPVLSVPDLYALVRRHGAPPGVDRVMVAAALAESGGDPQAIGDGGQSAGLWQLHALGLGFGMTLAERQDPERAAAVMVPVFLATWDSLVAQGYAGEDLAVRTYLASERPYDWQNLLSAAAQRFLAQYRTLPEGDAVDWEARWGVLERWRAHVQGVWVPQLLKLTRSPRIRDILKAMQEPVA